MNNEKKEPMWKYSLSLMILGLGIGLLIGVIVTDFGLHNGYSEDKKLFLIEYNLGGEKK